MGEDTPIARCDFPGGGGGGGGAPPWKITCDYRFPWKYWYGLPR